MEPNRKYTPDIEPDIRPDLRSIPGGGETTPGRGDLKAVPNNQTADNLSVAEGRGNYNAPSSNQSQAADYQRETEGDKVAKDNNAIRSTYTGKNSVNQKISKLKFWRNTGIIGGGGIIGIVIAIIAGITPLGGILINLGEVATANRDTQNNILTRRLYKVIDTKMTSDVTSGSCEVVKVACRFSRPSNAFLSRLDDYGIKALKDGVPVEKTRVGYPNGKPTSYTYKSSSGADVEVKAVNFVKTLRSDAEFRKAFTSAYNMRYFGYADSYIKNLFYKKHGIDRSGKTTASVDADDPQKSLKSIAEGADPDNKVRAATTAEEKNSAARTAINEAIEDEAKSATKKFTKSGADPAILAGTIACTAINAPGFFTKVSRLYQMRQEIALASAIVLTASSMAKTGDIDPVTMSTIGGLLTATAISSDGTKKSAMDSFGIKNLLFNDARSSSNSYKKFIPGYGAMTATKGITAFAQAPAVKSTCDTIYSPQAQIAAGAIEAGIGAATGGVGAVAIAVLKVAGLGLIAVLGADAISGFVAQGVQSLFSLVPEETVAAVLGNEDITNAKGEDLGNVLGGGINYFFSNAALSTGSAPLTTDQLVAYSNQSQDTMVAYAEQERSGKSPFDVSSPYTFLGSIVANYYTNAYVPNDSLKSITSSLGYMISQPLKLLSTNTYAATDNTAARYSYAEEFGVDTSVAVGPYGEMYAGIPVEFSNASTLDVLASVEGQYEEASGAPKSDGEIQEVLDMCSSGDLMTAKGCTITDQKRADKSIYMYDLRLSDLLDGREYQAPAETPEQIAPVTGKIALPVDAPYRVGDDFGPRPSPCPGCSTWHVGYDFSKPAGSNVYAALDGEVTRVGVGQNNIVFVKHADGLITTYWHMSQILAKAGDKVTAGQVIGKVGTVGQSTGNHLHFELVISSVADASVYDRYTKNSAGPAVPGSRIDPYQFFSLNGVPGI